ncbi:hypothetical protein [Reyranella sp.]|uniref:hypothetical protein n=1 Tax=Reyranella sp. TaxID=1929291 RepID=UPI003BADA0CF
MAEKKKLGPKRVVYLWGAGATQAEAHRLGAPISLLMRDTEQFETGVATRILNRLGSRVASSYGSDDGVDIEKLISLLSACGSGSHIKLAERMRLAYFAELRSSLAKAGVLDSPYLARRLLQMQNEQHFKQEVEALSGFITTNHDGLLQVASQEVFRRVNVGFEFTSSDFTCDVSAATPPILQLHGSFTWEFGNPIAIKKLRSRSPYGDTVWIPPTILKESKSYPFNKLTGQAYELLTKACDVLRVVGASLTQNDWNILSLIFNAQRHKEANGESPFNIELIMPQSAGDYIKRECAYLRNVRTIGHLTEGKFTDYIESEFGFDSDLANPFAYWLNEKIEYHRQRDELSSAPSAALAEGVSL